MSLRQAWLKWKTLRLPWRRQFLIGEDLNGNTYWEFKDSLSNHPHRMRRIVKGRRTLHHSDVQDQISPLWHQWLRQTRFAPPTMEEQTTDVRRQIQLKHNAMLADERWNAKKKYIEKPKEDPHATIEPTTETGETPREQMERKAGAQPQDHQAKPDPWEQERQKQKQTATNPSGQWQPDSWAPGPRRR